MTGLVGSLLGVPLAPAAGTEDPPNPGGSQRAEATPLRVTIDSLTPSTLPRRGKVTVSGQPDRPSIPRRTARQG